MFIDATYEGDLGAAAGVPFRTGREGAGEYGEPCAGKIYRWWKHGPDADGTTYEGDDAIQAYNYRLCLTDDPQNRLAIPGRSGTTAKSTSRWSATCSTDATPTPVTARRIRRP